jgi:hypothetical protein
MKNLHQLHTTPIGKNAVMVVAFVTVASFLGSCSDKRAAGDASTQAAMLIDKAREWLAQSKQDSDNLYKFQHLMFATAYTNAARQLAPDDAIERASKTHVRSLVKQLEQDTDAVMRQLQRKPVSSSSKAASSTRRVTQPLELI